MRGTPGLALQDVERARIAFHEPPERLGKTVVGQLRNQIVRMVEEEGAEVEGVLLLPAVPNHSPIQEMRQEKRDEKRKGGVFGRATAAQGRLSSASIRCR